MTRKSSVLLTAVAIIAAGGASAYASTPEPAKAAVQRRTIARPIGLNIAPDGIMAVTARNGHTDRLDFGAPMDNAIRLVSTATGGRPVADSVNRNCGAGVTRIVRFRNGLRLLGQDNLFRGWEINQRGLGTMDGIEVGTTRARLNQQNGLEVSQSTLGTEFTIGTGETIMGGLLSAPGARGRVTTLWAGLTCHMT